LLASAIANVWYHLRPESASGVSQERKIHRRCMAAKSHGGSGCSAKPHRFKAIITGWGRYDYFCNRQGEIADYRLRYQYVYVGKRRTRLHSAHPIWLWHVPKWWFDGYFIWWRSPDAKPKRWWHRLQVMAATQPPRRA